MSGKVTSCVTLIRHRRLSDAVDGRVPATAAKGFASRVARSTDSTIYHVVEGQDWSLSATKLFIFPQKTFLWRRLHEVSFRSSEDTVLFSFSDKPVQEARGCSAKHVIN